MSWSRLPQEAETLLISLVVYKGRFFSEGIAKILQFVKIHSFEPKIVPELLFPVHVVKVS